MSDTVEYVHVLDALRAVRDKRKGVTVGSPLPAQRDAHVDDPDDVFGGPKLITDPARYASTVLERTLAELAGTDTGGRNAAAHKAGQVVGRLVGAQLVTDANAALNNVVDACRRNGLVDDDGLKTVQDSVASGYRWGVEHPVEWQQAPTAQRVEATPVSIPTPGAAAALRATNPAITAGLIDEAKVLAALDDPFTDPATAPADPRTSWWPTPILDGSDEIDDEPPPAIMTRSDGQALVYAGKVNALIGESESGKTWVALYAIMQTLTAGGKVAMLDFEDTRRGVRSRLRQLGCSDAELSRFYYAQPDSGLTPDAAADVGAFLGEARPALIALDGVNAAMTQLGYDLQDNKDVTQFTRVLLKPLTRLGAAVLTIDHVTKSKDGRGSYAIGAQAKRADVDGVALIVEVVEAFGRGLTGRLRITVSKDRPGYVRGASVAAKRVGDMVIASNKDGNVSMTLHPPDTDQVDARRVLYIGMEAVCDAITSLGAHSPPTSQEDVRKIVGGKRDQVIEALGELERRGHVVRDVATGKPRAGLGYRVVRPFQAALGDANEGS